MNKLRGELETPKRSKDWMNAVAKTQQQAIDEAEQILENVLHRGISDADIEYREEICYDIEALIDYFAPGILRSFRHLFTILYHFDNPKMQRDIVAHMNYLLVVVEQAKKYIKHRIDDGAAPDVTSLIEAHLGYLWKNIDLLEYKMYELDAEILQLSFNCIKDNEKMTFVDKGYWFDLKSRKIHYTYRTRPIRAARYIKDNNTEFDVLQPEKLFVYPGKTNCRIRWGTTERREVTPKDIAVLHEDAETDYAEIVSRTKEGFRDPLLEYPAMLIKLHKTFINGDHLVLEDEKGGLLTVMDVPKDNTPTTELLRAVLPAQPVGCALLIEINDDLESDLFSVKPLSIITPDRIIRLLY